MKKMLLIIYIAPALKKKLHFEITVLTHDWHFDMVKTRSKFYKIQLSLLTFSCIL
jgi:hypothetical protein